MTLYHFGNCLALAYGPYFLTYKYSGLPEYGAFWKCVQVGGMYMLTQLCKMLLLATFFPPRDGVMDTEDVTAEFVKTTLDIGDLVGISIIMNRLAGSGQIKVLVTGLGWAAADLLLTKALTLWVGARGLEFDWKYIEMSLDANVTLVHHLSVAALLWLWLRSDLAVTVRPLIGILLLCCVYRPLLPYLLASFLNLAHAGFAVFILSSFITFCISFIVLYIFVAHCFISCSYINVK